MANSLFQQLNNMASNNSAQGMLRMVRNAANPVQMITSLANNNSTLKGILDDVRANGGDAKALFYKRAQQMGIDPNVILNQLK